MGIGSRLLTVNTYKSEFRTDKDLIVGPLAIPRWSGFEPIIADFLTEDFNRIQMRKNYIEETEWERTFKMGKICSFINNMSLTLRFFIRSEQKKNRTRQKVGHYKKCTIFVQSL